MGALGGDAIRPGESIPFRLLPPDGGAIGPIADPVYISIPFDELGGGPGSVRWAICDQGGKVIDSNDADRAASPVPWPCHTPGFLIQAHAGAFLLTVENKETGRRIVGPPVQEWEYKSQTAGFAVEGNATDVAEAPGSDEAASKPSFGVEPAIGTPDAVGDQSPGG